MALKWLEPAPNGQ